MMRASSMACSSRSSGVSSENYIRNIQLTPTEKHGTLTIVRNNYRHVRTIHVQHCFDGWGELSVRGGQ